MNSYIIINFRPFAIQQEILVYTNDKCIDQYHVTEDQIVNIVKRLKTKYNINSVNLVGNNDYLKNYCQKLGADFAQTDIHIISR